MCMFCRLLFVLLYYIFWPLCCLFFCDIRILITSLVSSNSSLNFLFLATASILDGVWDCPIIYGEKGYQKLISGTFDSICHTGFRGEYYSMKSSPHDEHQFSSPKTSKQKFKEIYKNLIRTSNFKFSF